LNGNEEVSESSKVIQFNNFTSRKGGGPIHTQIISVGGGKGGVGKSFVSSNLAIFLANMGYNTIAIDLDLGAANLHTYVGEKLPSTGLTQFLLDEKTSLEEFVTPTQIANLRLISGHNDSLEIPQLEPHQKSRLMTAISSLSADYVIIDLSAGTHETTLDFFLMAQKKLVVLAPEPTSIENAYRFMKAAFFQKIKRFGAQLEVKDLIDELMRDCVRLNIRSPSDLLTAVSHRNPEKGKLFYQNMKELELDIILNQVRTRKDAEMGHSIKLVCNKYFGLPTDYLGFLEYDNAVWQSLRKHMPLIIEYPHSRLYAQLLSIARHIAHPQYKKAVV
jgi:flagellar biosynthesis protein FlhG